MHREENGEKNGSLDLRTEVRAGLKTIFNVYLFLKRCAS